MTPVGRATNYSDPPDLSLDVVDFDDPLELAAIALHRFGFATPDEVASMLTGEHGRDELAHTWTRLEPADRQLARRRADVVVVALELAERRAEARG